MGKCNSVRRTGTPYGRWLTKEDWTIGEESFAGIYRSSFRALDIRATVPGLLCRQPVAGKADWK